LGDELSSSLLKALGHDMVVDLAGVAGAQKGDAVLIVAGKPDVVAASLGSLRNEVARREKLIPEGRLRAVVGHRVSDVRVSRRR
jgi:aspartyl-tRNA synthetase